MDNITATFLLDTFIAMPAAILLIRFLYKKSVIFHIGVAMIIITVAGVDVTLLISQMDLINLIWAVLLIIAAGVVALSYLKKTIGRPLNSIDRYLLRLSSGDLSVKNTKSLANNQSEVGSIARSLWKLKAVLVDVTTKIKDSSSHVNVASNELNAIAQQVNKGASSQASATEEASASMEEMTANAEQNKNIALEADKISEKVQNEISIVNDANNVSNQSLQNIVDKIAIINEIAQKTDLLAINAAIEAARAGEHGKGFSVVAGEVRKLAEESLKAATQINQISIESIENAKHSTERINNIIPDIDKMSAFIKEIANAELEQNAGSQQINKAIQELTSITQQNAASAEEMASSSEELQSQSVILDDILSFFKTSSSNNKNLSSTKKSISNKSIKSSIVKHKPTKVKNIPTKITNKKTQTIKPEIAKAKSNNEIPYKPDVTRKGFDIDLGIDESDDGFEKF